MLGGTACDLQHALASVGANRIEGGQLYFPVQGEDAVPRRILVASRRCSPLNTSTSIPPGLTSSECSDADEDDAEIEVDKIWDVASTPTLESLLPSDSVGRGSPPCFLFSSKHGSTTLESDIDVSELLADSPEVIRAGMNNGSLVPAYGSTGGCRGWQSSRCLVCLFLFCFLICFLFSLDGEDSDLSRTASRI